MAGRPKIFEEKEIISKAIDVFWLKGYEASSTEELLNAMNIGKGSFYLAFKGGKKELFEKSLIQFSEISLKKFGDELKAALDPIDYLKKFFLSLADSPFERKSKGCYLGNAIVELANSDYLLKDQATTLLTRLEENFMNIIHDAQSRKLIKSNIPANILARHLINLWNGINVTRRMYPDSSYLKEIINLNLTILE